MRRALRQSSLLLVLVVATAAPAGCGAAESGGSANARSNSGPARGLPGLRNQANQLLDGGTEAFKVRLAELRGHPVVVNQWASWCGPCRSEFPFLGRQARKYSSRIAFLGVDSQDNRGNAAAFLKKSPVPYPHYFDPNGSVARVFRGGRAFPTTVFYDSSGKLVYTHVGAYPTEAKLDHDVRRYALRG